MDQRSSKYSAVVLIIGSVSLVACGGSGGGSGGGESMPVEMSGEGTVVTTETSESADMSDLQNDPVDESTDEFTDDLADQVAELPMLLSGEVAAGQLNRDGRAVYQVPSGAQVLLTSETGNADLFLYNSPELDTDSFLCASALPFRADSCSASDSEVYALVFGRDASDYSITVTTDCSVGAINEWAYRNMQDYYIFADSLPVVDPSSYQSADDLVRDIRLEPYSGVSNAANRNAFFAEGSVYGPGFRARFDEDGDIRVQKLDSNSPVGRTGLIRRGDFSVGMNNLPWEDISDELYDELIGDEENPGTVVFNFIDNFSDEAKDVTVTPARYNTESVPFVRLYDHPSLDGRIGYIVFDSFITPAQDELNDAFDFLLENNATELVLDLRYNGGGFTSIARRLAAQIGGSDLANNLLVRYEHNDKYTIRNQQRFFEPVSPELNMDRVVVLTTAATASSSELVINSLRPYIDVVVIGEPTEGKGFISFSNEYCGMALSAMHAVGVNANEVSVTGGITPNCHAIDDLSLDFGITNDGDNLLVEGMLRSGIDYLVFGSCETAPVIASTRTTSPSRDVLPGSISPAGIDAAPGVR